VLLALVNVSPQSLYGCDSSRILGSGINIIDTHTRILYLRFLVPYDVASNIWQASPRRHVGMVAVLLRHMSPAVAAAPWLHPALRLARCAAPRRQEHGRGPRRGT